MADLVQAARGRQNRAPDLAGGRPTTVLFAGVGLADDGASNPSHALSRCLAILEKAAELSGGRVLNKRDAEMLAVFATADAAAAAAARMQIYSQTIPQKFEVRAAFHTGPVSQRGKDIFGDTVNLALRLVDEAKAGQIVTSGDTAQSLSPAVQDSVRPLRSITVQGTDRSLVVGEFIWRRDPAAPLSLPTAHAAPIKLKLAYGVIKWVLRRAHDRLSIGRDTDCDLAVRDAHASRRHCTIARSNAGFILQDHSSNGTFVTTDSGSEVRLRKAEFSLGNRGWIAFGQSRAHTSEVVEYWCLRD